LEAATAIERLLLTPTDENSAEYRAIGATQLGIDVLLEGRCTGEDGREN